MDKCAYMRSKKLLLVNKDRTVSYIRACILSYFEQLKITALRQFNALDYGMFADNLKMTTPYGRLELE